MINCLLTVYAVLLLVAGLIIVCKLYGLALFDELLVKENPAVALALSGFVLGLLFALTGLAYGPISLAWSVSLPYIGLEGLLALALLILTVAVTDRLLLPRFPIVQEISADRNIGVACVVAGVSVSAGLVINGTLCGYSTSILTAVRDVVLYWILAQLAIWITLRVIIALRPFDFLRQLEEDDNLASGLSAGFFVICLGVLARSAVIHSGQADLWWDLGNSLWRWLLGLAGLVAFLSVQKLILRRCGTSIMDLELANSPAPVSLLGVLQLAMAILIGLLLQRPG
jgi:uncharacterized membrane protein YjfL (UPF0719 family)